MRSPARIRCSFGDALARVPIDIPRVEHGRDLSGIDCWGLMFLLYGMVGAPLGHLDVPYTLGDADRDGVDDLIHRVLSAEFDVARPASHEDWRDGDVMLVWGSRGRFNHAGVVVGKHVVTMTTRLRKIVRRLVVPHVYRVYRHRGLSQCHK